MGIGQKLARASALAKFRRIAGTYDTIDQARWLADNAQSIEIRGTSVKLPELGLHFQINHPCSPTILKKLHLLHSLHRRIGCTFSLEEQNLIANLPHIRAKLTEPCDVETYFEIFGSQYYQFSVFEGSTVFIDVGMNIGLASLHFHSQHEGFSYGFELMPGTFQRGNDNISLNSLNDKHFSNNFGLSNVRDEVPLTDCPEASPVASIFNPSSVQDADTVLTQVKPAAPELQEILANHEGSHVVLKLDAEGAEFEIIESLRHHGLLKEISLAFIEVHPRSGKSSEEITTHLLASGFTWSKIMLTDSGICLVTASNSGKLMRTNYHAA